MSQTGFEPENNRSPSQEVYSVGYGPDVHAWHLQRSAANRAAFFLPYLRPGMSLLDCGCGPGSITIGLAGAVLPGHVMGIDIEPRQVERAMRLASQQRITNLRFAVASVYRLPFPDASFDAAFAHNLLEHLRTLLEVIREMRRVLKPGGIIAVRDPDLAADWFVPPLPLVEAASRLLLKVREHNGSSPYYARHQRRLLLEAGFARSEGFAFAEYQGNAMATAAFANVLIEALCRPETVRVAVEQGWANPETLAGMADAIRSWAEQPDALHALVDCAAIGWV